MSKRKITAGVVCSVAVAISTVISWGNVKTNEAGLEIIGNAEQCRRDPYYCPAGKLTDGLGNTHDVYAGKTDEQIYRDWERNILDAERCINRYFRGDDMPVNAFSAMTSAAFNMGCPTLRTYYSAAQNKRIETSISKWAQKGDWINMCNHLPDFKNSVVNGKLQVLRGLEIRRGKERELCLSGLQ